MNKTVMRIAPFGWCRGDSGGVGGDAVEGRRRTGAEAWALVCHGRTCLPPITDAEGLLKGAGGGGVGFCAEFAGGTAAWEMDFPAPGYWLSVANKVGRQPATMVAARKWNSDKPSGGIHRVLAVRERVLAYPG